jgi:hypothetical protein
VLHELLRLLRLRLLQGQKGKVRLRLLLIDENQRGMAQEPQDSQERNDASESKMARRASAELRLQAHPFKDACLHQAGKGNLAIFS